MTSQLLNHKLVLKKSMVSHSNLITEEREKVDTLTDNRRPNGVAE